MFYDREGNEISFEEFDILDNDDYRRVGMFSMGPYIVSTVLVGIDCSVGHSPPMIFETMLWANDHSIEQFQRYATEAEAITGHEKMCQNVRELITFMEQNDG